jgi:hypothetical protein
MLITFFSFLAVTNGTLLPPDHHPHHLWSLFSLTETIVLLFALEPCSLQESKVVLLYVALRLLFFQSFLSCETRRVITLHFIKDCHYCYPAGDIRPEQRMKRGKGGPERENLINWEIELDGGGTGTKWRR